jgi:Holliday junction resolvase-like predicted endonuclease
VADLSKGTKGGIAELKAAAWLSERGYEVFRNVTQDGPADLVAWNTDTGEALFVDVKSASVQVMKAGKVVRRAGSTQTVNGAVYTLRQDQILKDDCYTLGYGRLTEKQRKLGVRLLLVLDDYIGWEEDHPAKMLDKLVKAHYIAKKQAKSSENSTILLDQGTDGLR